MGLPVIHTDDTTIKVLAPGHGKTRTGRFWVYAADPRVWAGSGPPAAFYRYSPDRDGERPRAHLAGFSGFLHADAYAGYGALYRPSGQLAPRVTHVACFAHARRKFFEVWEATKSPIAEEAVRRIAKLYEIEAEIAGRDADVRLAARRARSQPLLDEFHNWANAQRRRLSGKAALGRAFNYALSRWAALSCLAQDGRLSIDNNLSERQPRGVAITRKNFMFVGSDRGGDRAAVFYTLIEPAKLNGLDPEAYIAAIINCMATGHASKKLDALLPWNFELAEAKAAWSENATWITADAYLHPRMPTSATAAAFAVLTAYKTSEDPLAAATQACWHVYPCRQARSVLLPFGATRSCHADPTAAVEVLLPRMASSGHPRRTQLPTNVVRNVRTARDCSMALIDLVLRCEADLALLKLSPDRGVTASTPRACLPSRSKPDAAVSIG
jgi:hypothetical protein